MAIHWRTQGIILKKRDQGESDRIFTVFTRDFGKLDVWAISERKITSKLRSGLETLCLSSIEFIQGKTKKTLTDAIFVERYSVTRSDLTRLRVAFRIIETLALFLKGQVQDLKVWSLLQDSLATLNNAALPSRRCVFVYYYFFWNLVSCLGWRPRPGMYDSKISHMLTMLLRGDSSLFFDHQLEKFPTKYLNEVSRRYFVEIQKELQ